MGVLLTFFVGSLALAADTVSIPLYCLDGSNDVRPAASTGSATPYDSCKALLPGCSGPVAGRATTSVAGPDRALATFLKDQLKDQIALYIAGLYNGWQIDPAKTTPVAPGSDGVMEVKPVGAKKFTESVCSVIGWDYAKWRDSTRGHDSQAAALAELENEKFTGSKRPCGIPPVLLSDDEQKNIQFKIGTQGGGRVSAYLNGAFIFTIKRMLAETNAKIDEATKSGGAGKIDIATECAPSAESVNLVHNGAAAALTQMNASSMNSCSAATELGSASLCGQPSNVLGQNLVPLCGLRNSVKEAQAGLVNALACHTIKGASSLYDYMFRSLMTRTEATQDVPEIPTHVAPVLATIKANQRDAKNAPPLYRQAAFLRDALFFEAGKNSTTRAQGGAGADKGGSYTANLFRFRQRKAACWGAAVLALPAGVVKNRRDDYWLVLPKLDDSGAAAQSSDDPSVEDSKFICRATRTDMAKESSEVAIGVSFDETLWKDSDKEKQRKLFQDKNVEYASGPAGQLIFRPVETIRFALSSKNDYTINNGLLGIIERQIKVMCQKVVASHKSPGPTATYCDDLPYSWDVFKAKYGKYRWLAP